MLEIKPIEDKNEQEKLCRLCGIEYREEFFAYKAYEDGKPKKPFDTAPIR